MKIKNFADARHLAARLEIGVDDEKCQHRVGQHVADVLSAMLPVGEVNLSSPIFTPWEEVSDFYDFPIETRREMHRIARLEARQLTSWWLEQIQGSAYPLLERMTIFWHNHFTSNANKVVWPQFMYRQNQLFRQHALGNFADLLRGVTQDPAMLTYLDVIKNVAGKPNENFARELLELFTLGDGHYSEADIVNASRAFTGWGIDFVSGEFMFRTNNHDDGVKSFLGREANLNGDDIINILLQTPRTAEYIAEKFWAEFINHDTPDSVVIKLWARVFRDSGYEISALLNEIIHSQAFWDESNRGTMIKSPVEFSVGLLRELRLSLKDFNVLNKANQQLGQDLFYPPDVKGWRGGKDWITNTRLIRRYDLIPKLITEHSGDTRSLLEDEIIRPRMLSSADVGVRSSMMARLMERLACSVNSGSLTRWLLATDPVLPPDCDQPLMSMLSTLLRDPAYQLK
ncbi:MAG: DUF1800 domain-containing protein [Thiolinea sp.]